MTSITKRAYVTSAMASTAKTNFSMFPVECWIRGGLVTREVSKVVVRAHLQTSYLPKRVGILASMAPTMLKIYIGSHTGKGWPVT